MKDQNKCFFTGRLTRDPELRRTPSGKPVTNFSIAVNDNYKNNDGEWCNKVVYVDFVVWNGQGEALCKLVKKGNFVRVEAAYSQESWDDKNTGERRTATRFNVSDWQLLEKSTKTESTEEGSDEVATPEKPKRERKPTRTQPVEPSPDTEEDIPF